jgi:hypothetical protein
MKALIKTLLGSRGYELYRRPWLPRGFDPWETLRSILPACDPKTALDIGAFNGDTAMYLNSLYPRIFLPSSQFLKHTGSWWRTPFTATEFIP